MFHAWIFQHMMKMDMTTELIVDVYPMSQFTKSWDEREGEVFFHIDIANEPRAIADGYEWDDL